MRRTTGGLRPCSQPLLRRGVSTLSGHIRLQFSGPLEYEAIYSNSGSGTLRQLQATVPIPAGSVHVADSTQRTDAFASVDGVADTKMPLQRSVRQANRVITQQPVALSGYRFVRWSPSDLPAGAARTVSVRVTIPNDAAVANLKAVK